MSTAELKLSYFDEGKRDRAVSLLFAELQSENGVEITVFAKPEARPNAMCLMFALGLSALLQHYSDQGIMTPLTDLAAQLDKAIALTNEAIQFEMAVETTVKTIGITPEQMMKWISAPERPLTEDEVRQMFDASNFAREMDQAHQYDELHLCANCQDAYTTGRLCRMCAEQEAIDRDC